MFRFVPIALIACCFIVFTGCEKDNFDIIEETPEVTEPVVVETEEVQNYISYRMPSGAVTTQTGVGLINEQGFVGLATSETATAECLEGGVISLGVSGSGLYMAFVTEPVVEPFIVGAFDLEGGPDASAFRNPVCESSPPVLSLTTLTDEQAAGTLSIEFFTLNPDNPTSTACEDAISLGVFDVEFDVALQTCN